MDGSKKKVKKSDGGESGLSQYTFLYIYCTQMTINMVYFRNK